MSFCERMKEEKEGKKKKKYTKNREMRILVKLKRRLVILFEMEFLLSTEYIIKRNTQQKS